MFSCVSEIGGNDGNFVARIGRMENETLKLQLTDGRNRGPDSLRHRGRALRKSSHHLPRSSHQRCPCLANNLYIIFIFRLRGRLQAALCLSNRHGSHGFTTGACVFVKSPTFLETMVRLWWIAVAASKPSIADKGLPLIFAAAASKPQRSATAASIDRILPEKRACSSTSSHVSRRLRRLP